MCVFKKIIIQCLYYMLNPQSLKLYTVASIDTYVIELAI